MSSLLAAEKRPMSGSPRISIPALDRPQHHTLTGATVDALRRAIDQGVLAPGAQLPSEMELIAHLRVSRTTVREALRVLENEGRIERRHGRGTFVSNNPIVNDF